MKKWLTGAGIAAAVTELVRVKEPRGYNGATPEITGGCPAPELARRLRSRGRAWTERVERCEIRRGCCEEERVVGYDVKYRYNDRGCRTRMDRDPGDSVRVRVNVSVAG